MKSKRIISILLIPIMILTITLCDVKKAQGAALETAVSILAAAIIGVESSETYQDWYDNELQPHYISMMNEVFERTGLVKMGFNENFTDTLFHTIGGDPIQNFRQYMSHKNNVDPSSITDDQAKQGLYNMFNNSHVEGSNVTIADDLKQYFLYIQDSYIDSLEMFTLYGCDLQASLNSAAWGPNVYEIGELINSNPYDYIIIKTYADNATSNVEVLDISTSPNYQLFGVVSHVFSDAWSRVVFYCVREVNGLIKAEEFGRYGDEEFTVYKDELTSSSLGSPSNNNYSVITTFDHTDVNGYLNTSKYQSCGGSDWRYYPKVFTKNGYGLNCFSSLTALNSYLEEYGLGRKPYYINNTVYNNWKNSSGDYTFSNDNSNHVTYGDITNYIDDHHSETGYYPTIPEINVYIENQQNPTNPTPTPGPGGESSGSGAGGSGGAGGSATATANNQGVNVTIHNDHTINFPGFNFGSGLSGNSVSGNSSGASGSDGVNFGFLGVLGNTLKSLIENIGKAIVDIITGISSVISQIVDSIPTVFGDFIGAVLGWLPPELQSLISLAVVAMVTYGLIKLIRG